MLAVTTLSREETEMLFTSQQMILAAPVCFLSFATYLDYIKTLDSSTAKLLEANATPDVRNYVVKTQAEQFLKIVLVVNAKHHEAIVPLFDVEGTEPAEPNLLAETYEAKKFDGSYNYIGKAMPKPLKDIVKESVTACLTHPDMLEVIKKYDFAGLINSIGAVHKD